MFDPFALARMWHRLWVASVRAVLPTKSVRDSRAYALGPARNGSGLPIAGQAVHQSRGDMSNGLEHKPSKKQNAREA